MFRIYSFVVAALLLGSATSGAAQGTEPLTHERLWSFNRVGAPMPSPDGRHVVFSVSEPHYDPDKEVSDLWTVPADGSAPPRRITATKGGESGVAWSPDSTRIAFAARRDGDEVGQIYVLDLSRGGEAQRVTNAPTAATNPVWSPDGTRLLFQAAMWPEATDEESNRKAAQARKDSPSKVRIYSAFPNRAFDKWLDESKAHLWVVDVEGDRSARSLLAGTALSALPGFDAGSANAVWTPDGAEIVFSASTNRHESARAPTVTSLWRVAAAGGEPETMGGDRLDISAARFSPDGATLCFTARDTSPALYHLLQLTCVNAEQGSLRVLTRDLDRAVGSWAFSPDGSTVYFTAEDGGHEHVYTVPVGGGQARRTAEASEGVYTSLGVAGPSSAPLLVANWESAVRPAEIVRIDPETGARTFLTSFNTAAAEATAWQPVREFWFTGRNGRRIRTLMTLPAGFDESKKYPLFVLMHGGHASSWRDQISYRWNYHMLTQPGFVLIATDYRGSTGYGEQFTRDIERDPLAGPADDINDAADEAIRQFPFIDGTRQAAGGASYGGHLANWMAVTTDRYKALVSHAGLATLDMQWGTSDVIHHREVMMGGPFWEDTDAWLAQSPLAKAGHMRTPILFSIGELDYRVPIGNTLAMYAAAQRMNVPSRLLVWPDENHWILKGENSKVFYREVREWLEKHLLAGNSSTASR
jgi:dipeptidyl aminopeptidase/acylaminoacyl peptidase